jgi:head-tail adaptor
MSDSMKAQPLYAGELRELVTFQQQKQISTGAATPDNYGHVNYNLDANWSDYCSRKAKVKAVGGQDILNPDGSTLVSTVLFEIRVRYDSLTKGIQPPMRILYGTHKLSVKTAIDPTETKQQMVITAQAQTS